MKPVILGGHERPIKDIIFNREDDFLFVASTDRIVSLWSTETNERIGTYKHDAAINCMRTTQDSKYLITGDSSGVIYIWEAYTGEILTKIEGDVSSPIYALDFGISNNQLSITYGHRSKSVKSKIVIINIDDAIKLSKNKEISLKEIPQKGFEINQTMPNDVHLCKSKLINCNKEIICAYDTGLVERRDIEGNVLKSAKLHTKQIMDLSLTAYEELALTSGKDGKSVLFDPETLQILNEFKPENPVRNINSGKISPLFNPDLSEKNQLRHCIIGGGQESKDVTFTKSNEGGFEILIYEMITGEELGAIGGHFSPINVIAISNNGKVIVSGAEEGTVRKHVMEEEYYALNQN